VTGGAVLNHYTNNGHNHHQNHNHNNAVRYDDSGGGGGATVGCCCLPPEGSQSPEQDPGWCRPTVVLLVLVALVTVFLLVSGVVLYSNCN